MTMNAVDYAEQQEEYPVAPDLITDDTLAVHSCHAERCEEPVDAEKLMCPAHWKMVSKPLQRRVLEHYREGQCADKRPSREWAEAARAAITAVDTIEQASEALVTIGATNVPLKPKGPHE